MPISRERVLSVLQSIRDPKLNADIVAAKVAQDIRLDGDDVYLRIDLAPLSPPLKESIKADVDRVLKLAGAAEVHIEFHRATGGPVGQPQANRPLPQVKNVIAVGAGKGGVGKAPSHSISRSRSRAADRRSD